MPERLAPLDAAIGGRVQMLGPDLSGVAPSAQAFAYQWPGTYFKAAFKGRTLYIRTGEGRQGLRLLVDRRPAVKFFSLQPSVYRVVGLSRGTHTVQLDVVTEGQAGPEHFGGFAVPPQDRLSPMQRRARQIEFIGDSYTVGYGNTSARRTCSREEVWATTDTSVAFGPLTAEHFGAEYQVNAISGRGVVRNYNAGNSDTLPVVYPFLLFDKRQSYGTPAWKPQVIVVGLGTNDFSTPLNQGEPWTTRDALHTDYESTYVRFMKELRRRNPTAFLILWSTDGAQGEIESETAKVVDRLKAEGETMLAFVPVNGLQMNGCDSHPSAADDRAISARLRSVLEAHPDVWQGKPGVSTGKD